ncbi:HIT family protein [Arthrobacter sp. MYb211]|uniref:HIT family protein n=1 Tax=unclassified Arthrobacter TaxID=235627 RepID=UPI000CFC64F0|nr:MULTISPECIES: HIT family protein [unclassified Arthrobacter]PRA13331.1 HIT family protein [Arthrobacter sp. MYb221]PRC10528.1 HIT family protein [Arthrobacter sp. MYb211]
MIPLNTARDACVFCSIVDRTQHAKDLTGHGGNIFSFIPLSPVTPGHRLFVPSKHASTAKHSPELTGACMEAAAAYGARTPELDFNLIVNAGPAATQTVHHLHIHYVPRQQGDGLHLPWTGQKK